MRQAGLKPKSHNSGVYWVRAHGGGGKGSNVNDEKIIIIQIISITQWYWVISIIIVIVYFYGISLRKENNGTNSCSAWYVLI